MTHASAYRVTQAEAVLARTLDDMTLLYHRLSGQTHMVISPVPELLAQLANGEALTVGQMHERLSRDFDLGERDEALDAIDAHLRALLALGLVRRA